MKKPAVPLNKAEGELIAKAEEVLRGNLKTGFSKWANTNYKYICPASGHYRHQWFWDSCFNAIVLSHLNIDLAKNEIRSLLKVQRENGFIPHIIYWDQHNHNNLLTSLGARLESKFSASPTTSELIQPPLIAQAVEAIYKKEKDVKFLQEVVPKLKAYYLWLSKYRDPDRDGLISIIAPYESGLDQSPAYDTVFGTANRSSLISALVGRSVTLRNLLRNYNTKKIFEDGYFNVEDVLVNSIYIKNLQVLSDLLHEIDNEEAARHFHHKALKGKETLIEHCYDKEDSFFYDMAGQSEKKIKAKTIKGLLPLILDLPKTVVGNIVKNHVLNNKEFSLPYPIPTVAASEASFAPAAKRFFGEPLLWRGPTWINTNWYIVSGLRKHGYKKEAEQIVEKSVELVQKSGFREFFNPFSGEGYGAHDFSWSTLVVDMLLS
ncbi:MAG: trehalase family glycosidase [Candidatus Woykebacteria bacterium]